MVATALVLLVSLAGTQAGECPRTFEGFALLSATAERIPRIDHHVCVYGTDDKGVRSVLQVLVYDTKRARVVHDLSYPPHLQTLGLFPQGGEPSAVPTPQLQDLNFDGFMDITLLSPRAGIGNSGLHVWIYRPRAHTFDYDEVLSELGPLEPDPKSRTLTSSWVMGAGTHGKSVVQWIDGKAVVVRDEVEDWNKEKQCREVTVRERRRGALVEVSRKCVDP